MGPSISESTALSTVPQQLLLYLIGPLRENFQNVS